MDVTAGVPYPKGVRSRIGSPEVAVRSAQDGHPTPAPDGTTTLAQAGGAREQRTPCSAQFLALRGHVWVDAEKKLGFGSSHSRPTP